MKLDNGLEITDMRVWPFRDSLSRVKANVSVTFNHTLRINLLRIVDGARGLFVVWPSEKKAGTDQFFPVAAPVNREVQSQIQAEVLRRYEEMMK